MEAFRVIIKSAMKSPDKIGRSHASVMFPERYRFAELQEKVEKTFPQCATEDQEHEGGITGNCG